VLGPLRPGAGSGIGAVEAIRESVEIYDPVIAHLTSSREPLMSQAATVEGRRPRQNLKDEVADHLRHLIFSGSLKPEQKVNQDTVAASMGVSKLPVREALIALEGEGLVESIPRRGVFVAALSPEDVIDHYRIYAAVLSLVASDAASRFTPEDVAELKRLHEAMESETDDVERERLNYQFHRKINVSGGSRRLLAAVTLLSRTMPSNFYEFATGWADIAVDQHGEVLEAIIAGDPQQAGEAMRRHIEAGGEHAVERLKSVGFWA
jgi:DNA-binding GntR family transcriptional regulator